MIDYNCLIGNWPFRKVRDNSFKKLQVIHTKYEIEYGYVANTDSIFYNDPYEGDILLAKKLKNSNHKMVISMNLNLPYLYRDIKKSNETFDYEGIRIYPSIHKYDLKGSKFNEFLHMVKENNKKLFISYRMGDIRLDHIIEQQLPDIVDIKEIMTNKYDNEIYLLNLKSAEVLDLKENFIKSKNVFFDTSDVKHETFAMEKFNSEKLNKKYVFGSFFPLYTFESSYFIYTRT